MLGQKSWQQLIRAGVPDNLIVSRRPLLYGDRTLGVGTPIKGIVPTHRMRPLYEARLIGIAAVAAAPAALQIEAKGKEYGIRKK